MPLDFREPVTWHARSPDDVLSHLGTSRDGLSGDEVARRRATVGSNTIPRAPATPAWRILLRQCRGVVVALLAAALVAAWLMGERADAAAIGAVLVLNIALGFVMELRSRRAVESLASLETHHATVVRGGIRSDIDARDLVPGDVIALEAGQGVPADARLIGGEVRVNESTLTGESVPISKTPFADIGAEASLPERATMAYAGTLVVAGSVLAVVVATGAATELGAIGTLVASTAAEPTPLERQLDRLGRQLVWVALAIAVVSAALSWRQGVSPVLIIQSAIALAVAAVPEGLPAVATIALALAVHRMARQHALVVAARKAGLERAALLGPTREIGEVPFSSERRWMAIFYRRAEDAGVAAFMKGTPGRVLGRCTSARSGGAIVALDEATREAIRRDNRLMAAAGLRVLALAYGDVAHAEESAVTGLIFVGLAGIADPPAPGVVSTIAAFRRAGIATVMITGDQRGTAEAIARELGLRGATVEGRDLDAATDAEIPALIEHTAVFSRVSPAAKLRLVQAYQSAGEVVAMIGRRLVEAATVVMILLFGGVTAAAQTPGAVSGQVRDVVVVRGDTLRAIGARYGVDPSTIARDNGIADPSRLSVGQRLRIDARHVVPSEATPDTIVVNVPQRMLFLETASEIKAWPVAVGRSTWPTPLGPFVIVSKEEHPTWYVPASIIEEARSAGRVLPPAVPPGPANPLGDYWLGLGIDGIGIHGTNAPSSIYQAATHGCVRLHPDDIAALFPMVQIGMSGTLAYEPVLVGQDGDVVVLEIHPDIYHRGPVDVLAYVRSRVATVVPAGTIDWNRVSAVIRERSGIPRAISFPAAPRVSHAKSRPTRP